ncbi:hypothetical protein H8958_007730 [Nasalis larvatus]
MERIMLWINSPNSNTEIAIHKELLRDTKKSITEKRSLRLQPGPRGTTGWARGPRRGLRGRGQGKRERQRQAGGEGGGAGLFLNSASTRSLALWFLRVVYSIFLFLRRPSPLRVRAETRGLVGSGSARGSLAGVGPPGASASWRRLDRRSSMAFRTRSGRRRSHET